MNIKPRLVMLGKRVIRKAHPEKLKGFLKTAERTIPDVANAMVDVCFINGTR